MTPAEIIGLVISGVNAAVGFMTVGLGVLNFFTNKKNAHKLTVLGTQTDGLTKELVKVTRSDAMAAGILAGRAQQADEQSGRI